MVAFGEPFSALLARGFSSGSSPKCCNKEKEEVAEEKDATQDGSNTNRLTALPTVWRAERFRPQGGDDVSLCVYPPLCAGEGFVGNVAWKGSNANLITTSA